MKRNAMVGSEESGSSLQSTLRPKDAHTFLADGGILDPTAQPVAMSQRRPPSKVGPATAGETLRAPGRSAWPRLCGALF